MEKNNYIEHEIKVKYADAILAQWQDWNWFIEYIESNFDLDDVKSWKEFETKNNILSDILSKFIRIAEIKDIKINIKNNILQEQYFLAKYYINKLPFDEINSLIKSNYSKIYLFFLWIAKLENNDNQTDYILDRGIYQYKNYWQLINFSSILSNKEELKAYAETIDVLGFEDIKSIIFDNIEQKYYEAKSDFITKYVSCFMNPDAFSHQLIKHSNLTWQESFLLDMLKVSIRDREIIPLTQFGENSNPDIKRWTKCIINDLKKYFNNDLSIIFILETISYILYKEPPSKKVILIHCELLTNVIKNLKKNQDIFCSSFEIISYLFIDNLVKICEGEEQLKKLMFAIHSLTEPTLLGILKEYKIPINTLQKNVLSNFYKAECAKIGSINNIHDFDNYLNNTVILKFITKNDFNNICVKFYHFISNSEECLFLGSLFYKFMIFLLNSRKYCSDIGKREVNSQLIKVQKTWQMNYYPKILDNLQEQSFTTTFTKEQSSKINKLILLSPVDFVNNNIPANNDYICSCMEYVSKYPMQAFVTNISIDETFPVVEQQEKMFVKGKSEIDFLIKETIIKILKNKGYKLLNSLTPEYFVSCIHKEWLMAIHQAAAIFNREKEVYNNISKNATIKLIEFNNELYLAHLTQLFPVLEIKIRELGILIGIYPFKEKTDEFWKYKDPSGILIEILSGVYNEIQDFGIVGDILMVYNFMYNSNSLNIRNECIHGRKYISDNSMQFAFKVTLLAISIIMQRIELITKEDEFKKNAQTMQSPSHS